MKKFILKSFLFLLLLAFVIGICDWGYLRINPFNTNKFWHVPDQIEICNIGASHSLYGFNYADYEGQYTTFNFGLDSQSHQYDYIILNHYKENIKKGAFVFIVVSYPTLIGKDETESETFESQNKRYYTFLRADEIRKYDFKTDMNMKLVPFINVSRMRRLLSNIIMGGGYKLLVTAD